MSAVDRSKSGAANRAGFDAFISACMDPLPDTVMLDTAHNRELRRALSHRFRVAQRKAEYYEYLWKAQGCAEPLSWYPAEPQKFPLIVTWPGGSVLRPARWEAELACLLTATGDPLHVAWKKRRLRRYRDQPDYGSVVAAIAQDEAFIAAHPVQRGKT